MNVDLKELKAQAERAQQRRDLTQLTRIVHSLATFLDAFVEKTLKRIAVLEAESEIRALQDVVAQPARTEGATSNNVANNVANDAPKAQPAATTLRKLQPAKKQPAARRPRRAAPKAPAASKEAAPEQRDAGAAKEDDAKQPEQPQLQQKVVDKAAETRKEFKKLQIKEAERAFVRKLDSLRNLQLESWRKLADVHEAEALHATNN